MRVQQNPIPGDWKLQDDENQVTEILLSIVVNSRPACAETIDAHKFILYLRSAKDRKSCSCSACLRRARLRSKPAVSRIEHA